MDNDWDKILNKYINKLISPDGRQTYESKPELVDFLIELSQLQTTDKVIDIGCGWGNFTKICSKFSNEVIGIEPNANNLKEAINHSNEKNIKYIQGSFEKLNYNEKVNKIISMLAFHQVPWNDKTKAFKNISKLLLDNGCFFLCDTMILFNPKDDPKLFDKVYRYILKETTPDEIYKKHIKPYLIDNEIYTLDDMRENTPKDNWFYSIQDIEYWAKCANLKLLKTVEFCPFFGVAVFQKEI